MLNGLILIFILYLSRRRLFFLRTCAFYPTLTGFSILPKETMACRLEQTEIELATFRLVDKLEYLLYLLSHPIQDQVNEVPVTEVTQSPPIQ